MNKVYVITGYGGEDSLGYAIATSIRETDPNAEIMGIVNPAIRVKRERCPASITYDCDLSNSNEIEYMTSQILIRYDKIHCLINCAGTNHMNWLQNLEISDYKLVMDVNLTAPIAMIKGLISAMDGGIVLNITSSGARKPFRTSLPYCVSKAGLVMATKQIAREVERTVVFAISPNQLEDTGLTKANDLAIPLVRGWSAEETVAYHKANSLSEDRPTAETTANFIAYLVTDRERCKHLSGSEIHYGE